jgi:RND family efflux transporter MFP subunit
VKLKKSVAVFTTLIIILSAGWYLIDRITAKRSIGGHQRPEAVVAVELSPVQQATIREIIEFTGSLYSFSEFALAPKVTGRLEKILVHIGDTVHDDQLVAVLDAEEYRQQVTQAEAELAVSQAYLLEARSNLENARREYERTVELRAKKIASESQRDAAESEFNAQQAKLKVAQAQVAQREAALRISQVRLQYTQIRVPPNSGNDRLVGERFVDEGALLAANTPIVSILDITRMIGVIHVIERDYARMRTGLEVSVTTDAYPGRTFPGRVLRIAPLLKEKSRQARVEIEIANADMHLKPGMFVKARIEFAAFEGATVVPAAALVMRAGAPGVFIADRQAHTAHFVPVTVGISEAGRTQIVAPALSGEVVTLGMHLLEDGAPIIVPGPNGAPLRRQAALPPADSPPARAE